MTKPPLLAAVLLAAALAGCGEAPAERPPLAGASIGGAFELVDKTGATVRWNQFDGKYRMVYFGYTFCPDMCPLDVQTMMRGFAEFEKAEPGLAAQVQPIFVTIDPERDTQAVVGEFAQAFSPRLLGLTGSKEQVAVAAKAFAVYYAKGAQSAGGYLMDHSRNAVLSGRKGEPLVLLPVDEAPPQEAAKKVAALLKQWVK